LGRVVGLLPIEAFIGNQRGDSVTKGIFHDQALTVAAALHPKIVPMPDQAEIRNF